MRLVVLRALGLGRPADRRPGAARARARLPRPRARPAGPGRAGGRSSTLLGDAVYAVHRRRRRARAARRAAGRRPRTPTWPSTCTAAGRRAPPCCAALAPRALIAFGAPGRAGATTSTRPRRWCRLLEAAGIPADPRDLDLAAPAGPPPHPGATVIHPGAAAPARRWPAERWAAVARAGSRGPVVVTAGPGEEALARSRRARRRGRRSSPATCARWRRSSRAPRGCCAPTPAWPIWPRRSARPRSSSSGRRRRRAGGRRPSARATACCGPAARGDPNGDAPDPGLLALQPHDVLEAIA